MGGNNWSAIDCSFLLPSAANKTRDEEAEDSSLTGGRAVIGQQHDSMTS
jgi:hypothetical protein